MQRFTTKDICAALGDVSRVRVQTWAKLPPFNSRPCRERSARRLEISDLLAMAVFQTLESGFGIRLNRLSQISSGIHNYLLRPRPLTASELIFISFLDGETYQTNRQTPITPGWIIDLTHERERIDRYLGIGPTQRSLSLIAEASRPKQ